jgi:LysR family transcriptional regulator, glycine cleavage system transcriptional activator
MKSLPPLNALVAFEAVYRRGSVQSAAAELHVTPGAVGQMLRKLETWLGLPLFKREVRRLIPTASARQYYQRVSPALSSIVQATTAARGRVPHEVRISMPPGIAAKWFAPRMGKLLAAHPAISLSLNGEVDLAIRHFNGKEDRLSVSLLARDEGRVYCTPEYRRKHRLSRPEDLLRAVLLDNTLHPHWPLWFKTHSHLAMDAVRNIPRIRFDLSALAIDAAARGQGVILTSPHLTEAERSSGALIEPFHAVLQLDVGYYLVRPQRAESRPGIRSMIDWLHAEFGKAPAGGVLQ